MSKPARSFDPREQLSLFDATLPLRSEAHAEELPATARRLVEVIGLDATIDLVKMYGGDEPVIPSVVGGNSRVWAQLEECIGPEAAAALVREFGNTPIYVPFCSAALRAARNREIVSAYDAGEPFDSIRRRYKVSRSYLYRLMKRG